MGFIRDPNTRRRVDAETQRNRDAEVARLRGQGVPFRAIASRLDMSLGAVQKAVRRAQQLAVEMADANDDDELAEAVVLSRITPEQIVRELLVKLRDCDDEEYAALIRYRLRHIGRSRPLRGPQSDDTPGLAAPPPLARPFGPYLARSGQIILKTCFELR